MASHFREVIAWQRAMDLASLVYRVSAKLPSHERYGLQSQMQRAAVSIAANIAEGHERRSRKEYRRFLAISTGSLAELETHLLLAERIGYFGADDVAGSLALTHEVGRIVRGIERGLARSSEP